MKACDITFGIEIETHIPSGSCPVGAYHVGQQVSWLPQGWKSMRDGSISAPMGREGCEFVSPILKGVEGIQQVIEVVKQLKEHGAKVNESTGFHVHVGVDVNDSKAMDRLITMVAHFEKAIYAATGTKNRESSRWCKGLQRCNDVATAKRHSNNDRYHVLNLTNIANGTRPTVEFRAFSGTLNIVKILGYISMCLAFVERASDTRIGITFKPERIYTSTARDGCGQSCLARLFYQLGWTKGRVNRAFGEILCDGAPTIKMFKKELMRLAKQYDAA